MKNMMLLGICALMVTGCGMDLHMGGHGPGVKGSGKAKTEVRTVGNFDHISNDGASKIVVKVGPKTSVKVTADDNLLAIIKTEIKDGALVISNTKSIRPKTKVLIEITTPELVAYDNDGAGDTEIIGIDSKDFTLTLDGAGDISAEGNTNDLSVSLDGAGNLELYGLKAKNVVAELDGAGNIEVTASDSLNATLDGAGNINYRGNPGKVERKRNGAGNISEG